MFRKRRKESIRKLDKSYYEQFEIKFVDENAPQKEETITVKK